MRQEPLLDALLDAMDGLADRGGGAAMLAVFVSAVRPSQPLQSGCIGRSIRAALARIDRTLSVQLAAVMHHPCFRALEGSWRGLAHLVDRTESGDGLKLKLLAAGKAEWAEDFARNAALERSTLHRLLFEEPLATHEGEPFGLLVADFEFGPSAADVELLRGLAQVAEAALCPVVAAAAPALVRLRAFPDLGLPGDRSLLGEHLGSPEFASWQAFRDSAPARFTALAAPRVLARRPYGGEGIPIAEFAFDEVAAAGGRAASGCLWTNAAYLLAAVVARSFAETGWGVAICGVRHGGRIEPFAVYGDETGDPRPSSSLGLEVGVTPETAAIYGKFGVLAPCRHGDAAFDLVFLEGRTCRRPQVYDTPDATENAAIMARLPFLLATSRLVHYLRAICRDALDADLEPKEMEAALTRWIANYYITDPKRIEDGKPIYAHASIQIRVGDASEASAPYRLILHVRPWLATEELTTEPRLVANLPRRIS